MSPTFSVSPLPTRLRDAMQATGAWRQGAPVSLDRLRLVSVSYVDFDGNAKHDGELAVLDAAAPYVASAFRVLYEREFPIHSVRTVDRFGADDDASMEANNSSAFNYRPIAGTDSLSVHSYGLAVDVNPEQNPYVILGGEREHAASVYPKAGKRYLNRTHLRRGMVEPIVSVFRENGFSVWGGDWDDPLDWHHFQTPRSVAEMLAAMDEADAAEFFALTVRFPDCMRGASPEETRASVARYREAKERFVPELTRRLEKGRRQAEAEG
jgi:hypothetical protein